MKAFNSISKYNECGMGELKLVGRWAGLVSEACIGWIYGEGDNVRKQFYGSYNNNKKKSAAKYINNYIVVLNICLSMEC